MILFASIVGDGLVLLHDGGFGCCTGLCRSVQVDKEEEVAGSPHLYQADRLESRARDRLICGTRSRSLVADDHGSHKHAPVRIRPADHV